jgi:hypothetical protein
MYTNTHTHKHDIIHTHRERERERDRQTDRQTQTQTQTQTQGQYWDFNIFLGFSFFYTFWPAGWGIVGILTLKLILGSAVLGALFARVIVCVERMRSLVSVV